VSNEWQTRLALASKLGLRPRVVFDCGAYRGLWAAKAAELFGVAQFVCFEPNPANWPAIEANTAKVRPKPTLVKAAVGRERMKATLHFQHEASADPSASLHTHVEGNAGAVEVDVVTLDDEAMRLGIWPDYLKLDLQGHEAPALEGARECLYYAEAVQAEVGLLDAYKGRTSPRELLDMLYQVGFVLYDMFDVCRRPHDGACHGCDWLFVRRDSGLRKYQGYR
jgi:FkbM family methyltransferase